MLLVDTCNKFDIKEQLEILSGFAVIEFNVSVTTVRHVSYRNPGWVVVENLSGLQSKRN